MALTIRDATVGDARAIAEVHVAAWRWAYQGQVPDDFLKRLSVEDRELMWREGLEAPRPGWGCLVATDASGSVVGFIGYGPPEEQVETRAAGEVYAVYLERAVVGTGVGRALLAEGTQRLRDAGWTEAFLWVLASNERARRFYELAGWTWDGTTTEHGFDRASRPIVRYAIDL